MFLLFCQPILAQISYNVPAVDEGFYRAIKTLGGVERGGRSRPSEMEPRGPLGPKRSQTCYVQ
jgi:hypothetical protein